MSKCKRGDKMHVLMLSSQYPPEEIAGLGMHVYGLATALSKKGHHISILTNNSSDSSEYEKINNISIYRVKTYPIEDTTWVNQVMQFNLAMIQRALQVILEINDIDLIHNHNWLTVIAANNLSKILDKPLVTTIHDTQYGKNFGELNEEEEYIFRQEEWLCNKSQQIITVSQAMSNELQSIFGLYANKIYVIPNGINYKEKQLADLNFKNICKFNILYLGRLVPEKGVDYLLEAVSILKNNGFEIHLKIAGSGEEENNLYNLAVKKNILEIVEFSGYVYFEEKKKLLAKASALVIPSYYEPFGIVALEGMAAGTPVVVSSTGGLNEIIQHGKNGLKFFPGDSERLAITLVQLLSDVKLQKQLILNGWKTIKEKYTWELVADKTIDIYRKVLQGGFINENINNKF